MKNRAYSCLKTLTLVITTAVFLYAYPFSASGGSESVAVVVNVYSWASTRIANEYIRLRSIPPTSNVIYLSGIDNFEKIEGDWLQKAGVSIEDKFELKRTLSRS